MTEPVCGATHSLPQREERGCAGACALVKKITGASLNCLLRHEKTIVASVSTAVALRFIYNVCAQEGNGLQVVFWQKLICQAAVLTSVSLLAWAITKEKA